MSDSPSFKRFGSDGHCLSCRRKLTPLEPKWFRGHPTPKGVFCFEPACVRKAAA